MKEITSDPAPSEQLHGTTIQQLFELHEAALAISSELELDRLLQQIVETARRLTRSRYAALGLVGGEGLIELFITSGISTEEREQLGELPRGHGLLGVLIKEGQPIRIPSIADDPRSVGFPANHPPMTTLLGMPIRYQGQVVGDLYLTDKEDAFLWSDDDEWLTGLLASHAAVAIGNAYLYRQLKEAREVAEADRRRLNVILANLPEGVVVCDAAGRVLLINQTAEQITGWQVGSNVHQPPFSVRHPDGSDYRDDETPISRTLHDRGHLRVDHMVVEVGDNGLIDLLASTAPLFDSEGEMIGAVALFQDITEVKAVERLKDEFFSMATHELRTPLTSITMSSGLLAELLAAQGGRVADLARLVDENARRMRSLVDDLLDISRLEHGRLRLHRTRFDLAPVLGHGVEEMQPLAARKNQHLSLEIEPPDAGLYADAGRVEQVVLNLLANAVKYTPEGGTIQLIARQDGAATEVAVQDNGPGISEAEQGRIFERFYRSKQHEGATVSGTGLGLPIALMLVELHGGRLWVEAAPGGGSIFRFTIPG